MLLRSRGAPENQETDATFQVIVPASASSVSIDVSLAAHSECRIIFLPCAAVSQVGGRFFEP